MFANTQQPNAHLDQLRNELPTHESASGTDFKPTHGGAGSLPGGRDESGVARLPDERAAEGRGGYNALGSEQLNTVPGTTQPLGSGQTYETGRTQEIPGQQETANAKIPGTYGYDPNTQNTQTQNTQGNQQPSRVEQIEGDVGRHDEKPSIGQRVKQGIKDMTSGLHK